MCVIYVENEKAVLYTLKTKHEKVYNEREEETHEKNFKKGISNDNGSGNRFFYDCMFRRDIC